MKHRIQLERPDDSHQFSILNGTATQAFTWWEFYPDWQAVADLQDLGEDDFPPQPKLDQVLRLVRCYATLWIGTWQGTIAPMDRQPQGWTYPSGQPLEPEWWWQWHPSSQTEAEALTLLNTNGFEAWERSESTPLKAGIPFQMQRNLGEVQAVNAISVQRLPDLMRKDAPWIFEFEMPSSTIA